MAGTIRTAPYREQTSGTLTRGPMKCWSAAVCEEVLHSPGTISGIMVSVSSPS